MPAPLQGSIRVDVHCPSCYMTPQESWPQKLYVFPEQPLATGTWYVCITCRWRIPWDQWLVCGGDFDIRAIGPIGGLPTRGDALNAIISAKEPPPPPPPSAHGGYLVKGPAYRNLHPLTPPRMLAASPLRTTPPAS